MRARPNYTIYEKKTTRAAYDAVPIHKAEKRAKLIRQVNLIIGEKVT